MKVTKLFYQVLILLLFFTSTANAQKHEANSVTYSTGVELDLEGSGYAKKYHLSSNQIGILLTKRVNGKLRSILGQRDGIKEFKEYQNGVYVLTLDSAYERSKLFELAYQFETEYDLISNAGVVIYRDKESKPMILTNSIIVQFSSDAKNVKEQLAHEGLEIISENPYTKGRQVLARVRPSEKRDSISASNRINKVPDVVFGHPDFITIVDYRQFTPNDALYGAQWHHNNNGASGGTVDADGDTDFAWTITRGTTATTIAILDNGFDVNHEDLTPNLWTNGGETPGNGLDDDNNGCIDDVNGCTFAATSPCSLGSPLTCGTGTITAANHGTSVAGVAAAQGNNTIGVSGACANCTIIPIQQGGTTFNDGLAIGYAGAIGADVFTNSWGYGIGFVIPANVTAAITNTAAAGTVIFWAMNNGNIDDCIGTADISANPNVIAISASSNQDRKVTESAFGNCMDMLAPTHRGYGGATPFSGTLNITTTDRTGNAGYNNASPVGAACPGEAANNNYTSCFGGTSSATPYAAGIAGLMVSAWPTITRAQVQRSLQDTADKIQDSVGAYSTNTGFSSPAGGGAATHGYGRVNAFEAVRLVAPTALGGRNNVDIYLRDNRLDWGNTEQLSNVLMEPTRGFIPHYQSVDIKIDAGPSFEPTPPTTSAQFDSFVDENPISGQLNRVYVRVHNRGANAAANVTVKLQWAFAGTALPALPSDYWSVFPADSVDPTNRWASLGAQSISNLAYSGASVAGTAADASQIVAFDFMGPTIDSSLGNFRHHCLLAVISSPQDPVLASSMTQLAPDVITPRDNNVTHKNVFVQDTLRNGRFRAEFFVRNPFKHTIHTRLRLVAPKGWKLKLEGAKLDRLFELKANSEKLVVAEIFAPKPFSVGRVEIRQSVVNSRKLELTHVAQETKEIDIGGVIYDFRDKEKQPQKGKNYSDGNDQQTDKTKVPVYKRGE